MNMFTPQQIIQMYITTYAKTYNLHLHENCKCNY